MQGARQFSPPRRLYHLRDAFRSWRVLECLLHVDGSTDLRVGLEVCRCSAMSYIVQRKDRFYVVAYDGLDPLSGKERRRWHPVGHDRDEAEAVRRRLDLEPRDEQPTSGGPITVSTFLHETWMPRKRRQVRATTAYRYAWFITHYITPAIGDIPLRRLRVDHLEDLYQHLAVTGGRHQDGLAPKTILEVHMIVRAALGLAAERHLVVRNVAASAQLKLPRAGGPIARSWTASSWQPSSATRNIIASTPLCTWPPTPACAEARSSDSSGATSTQLRAGCRSDAPCNASAGNPSSSASRHAPADAPSNSTKQRSTYSTLAATASTRRPAVRHRRLDVLQPDRPLSQPTIAHANCSTASSRSSDLPRIRFHDLRHTHASLLVAAGESIKVVSERLGHAHPAFTIHTYQHLLPGMSAAAADRFATMIATANR